MEKSFGLHFHLKKSKNPRSAEWPVYMRIILNGKTSEISLKRRCPFNKWNSSLGREEGKTESAKSLNSFLDVLQRKFHDIRRDLVENNATITLDDLKILLSGGKLQKQKYMIMEIFKTHNDQMKDLVGREYSPGTLQRYETSYSHTLSFLQWKYKVDDLELSQLNYEFLSAYEFWLKSVRKCEHNSTMKYLSNFRKIVNRCIKFGWLDRDPFLGFKMTKREADRVALTEMELEKMINKTFEFERLAVVRDIFLFSCYTGLAYADVKKLKRPELIIGIDGEKWIVSKRQKTETPARIPLLPPALNIINKYSTHPQCVKFDCVLPVLSNQRMNGYLKEIADCCGINKNLTYYIARHTFATTVTLSNGVPIETVSKMLGHRNMKTTQHYAKILDVKISQDMKMLRLKFASS